MMPLDGVLLVDKPTDWTSHDVCAFVRSRFHLKKVGHAGTLDPLATGLLVVLLGRATKISNTLSGHEKEYQGTMELGIQTDSHDRQGKVIQVAPWEAVTLEDIRAKTAAFKGDIIQVPPMVSALKHHGVRLYELARKGLTVPREGRNVTVQEFELGVKEGPFVHFHVSVSKGTYVRTLVNDLGEALGCYAALAALKRVRSGRFSLKDASTIEDLRRMEITDLNERVLRLSSVLS
ncbi:MAG: tRNA pseudouridine(55) synthase TruB [Candidatus Omnitrophica bacterium]|nr:tRNA pseudouridine(55) synthase TruB [Candidatus Omnitrophota bacterium]